MNLSDLNRPAIAWTENEACANPSPARISMYSHAIRAWHKRELELTSIHKFSDNWDGYGSEAPTTAVLKRAEFFLRRLKNEAYENPPMRMALSPNGSLTMDWIDGNALVRAEIQDSDEIEWMRAIPGKPTEFVTEPLVNSSGSTTEHRQIWRPDPTVEEELDSVQVQIWRPAPTLEEELDLVCAR